MIEARQHPNADRLKVCIVDAGRRAGAGRLRRAERAHRDEERVLAGRDLYSRARRSRSPRASSAASSSNGMLCSAAELELSNDHDGIIELPDDAPVGVALRALGRARRSGHRRRADAEPSRRDRRLRHRARSRGRRARDAQDAARRGRSRAPSTARPACVSISRPPDAHLCPAFALAARARRQERPVARMDAEAPARDRPAADQRAGRHHQLRHLRPRPPAACVRLRQGRGRPRRCGARGTARACWRSTARPMRSTRAWSSSPTPRASNSIAGVMGGERSGCDEIDPRRADRKRAVGPGQHRPDRPQARHRHRRALSVRARRRSGLLRARLRSRDRARASTSAAASRRA